MSRRVVWFIMLLAAFAQPAAAQPPDSPDADALRKEAEDDRAEATVHLLQARLAHSRGDRAAALRSYQRAWRYAPQDAPVLSQIVPLAFELGRNDEAARYAVLSAEREPTDPGLLRRLALLLTQQRDWERAVRLYEAAAKIDEQNRQPDEKLDLAVVAIRAEMGRLYFLAGQFESSAEAFVFVRDAIEKGEVELTDEARTALLGERGESYGLWAEAFLAAGRHDQAAALFRKAHELQPNEPLLNFQLARVESARGNPSAARRLLEEYFASKSTEAGAAPYELFAEQVLRHQPDEQAARRTTIERFEQLLQRDPENAALKQALAGEYLEANRLDKAEPLLAALFGQRASGSVGRLLAETYRRQNKLEKLAAVLASFAAQSGSLDRLGEALDKLATDRATVQRLVAQTRLKRRTRPDSLVEGELLAVGLVALQAQEWTAADELLAAAAESDKPGQQAVLLQWGLGMMLADQHARAATVFQRIIDEDILAEDKATPYYYLAAALEMSGRHNEALSAARKGAELKPDDPRMAARPAWILYHAGKNEAAREAYLELLKKLDEQHDPQVRAALREARMALSGIELARGEFNAAVEWLEQVLDEFPEDAGASNDLGYLWADRGLRLSRARRMIERAVAADPDNAAYRDSLGWVHYRLGNYDEAVKELEKAVALQAGEPDGVLLDHLGDALGKAGRADDAQQAWRKAAAAFEKEADAVKLEAVQKKLNRTQ